MNSSGRQVLLFYFEHLLCHEERLLQSWDTEELHDMRVATRRLRVACRVLRKVFGRKRIGPFNEQLKQLGWALGAVRDLDVFEEFVVETLETSGESLGLTTLKNRIEAHRQGPREALIRHLNRKGYHPFKEAFQTWLYGNMAPVGRLRSAEKKAVWQTVPALLEAARDEVLGFQTILENDRTPDSLHALRIACKRLRYTAEFFASCYEKRLVPMIKRATEFQDILGRRHDTDVHIAYLKEYIGQLDRRSSRQRRIQADLEQVIVSEYRVQAACMEPFESLWPASIVFFSDVDFGLRAEVVFEQTAHDGLT